MLKYLLIDHENEVHIGDFETVIKDNFIANEPGQLKDLNGFKERDVKDGEVFSVDEFVYGWGSNVDELKQIARELLVP